MGHVDDEVIGKKEIISYVGNLGCQGPVRKISRYFFRFLILGSLKQVIC